MKFYPPLLICIFLLYSSCNQEEPKSYFPFTQFLDNELKQIDSLPVAILKYSSTNDKEDTSIVDKKDFRKITTALLAIDLQNENISEAYKEQVLEDTDIKNISISYTTEKKQNPIKLLQLNIQSGTSSVKSFYVERTDNINDIIILRKILWSTEKSVTIASIYYKDKNIQEQLTEKYIWSIQ